MIPSYREGFKPRIVSVFGAAQICCGIIGLVVGIVHAAACRSPRYNGGTMLWPDFIFVLSGFAGLVAAKHKTNGHIITHMVLSIISAVIAAGLSLMDVYMAFYLTKYPEELYSIDEGVCDVMAVIGVVASLYGVEAILAIVSAGLCCKSVCCFSGARLVYTRILYKNKESNEASVPLTSTTTKSETDYVISNS